MAGMMGKIAGNLGLIPSLLYKDYEDTKRKEAERDERKRLAAASAPSEGEAQLVSPGMKKGGKVKKMAAGGSASKRADGCAQRGKTRGKMV